MKILLLLLLLDFASSQEELHLTAGAFNGRAWVTMDDRERQFYIVGACDAIHAATMLDRPAGQKLQETYMAPNCTFLELVAGVNAFYAEGPEMARIPIMTALALFKVKASGTTDEEYAQRKKLVLQVIAQIAP